MKEGLKKGGRFRKEIIVTILQHRLRLIVLKLQSVDSRELLSAPACCQHPHHRFRRGRVTEDGSDSGILRRE